MRARAAQICADQSREFGPSSRLSEQQENFPKPAYRRWVFVR